MKVIMACLYTTDVIGDILILNFSLSKREASIMVQTIAIYCLKTFIFLLYIVGITFAIQTIENIIMFEVSANLHITVLFFCLMVTLINVSKTKSDNIERDLSLYWILFSYNMALSTAIFASYYDIHYSVIMYVVMFLAFSINVMGYFNDFNNKCRNFESINTYETVLTSCSSPSNVINDNEKIRKLFLQYCAEQKPFVIRGETIVIRGEIIDQKTIDPKKITDCISIISTSAIPTNQNDTHEQKKFINDLILYVCEQNNIYISGECYKEIQNRLYDENYKTIGNLLMVDLLGTLVKQFGNHYVINELKDTDFWINIRKETHYKYRYNDAHLNMDQEVTLNSFLTLSITDFLLNKLRGYKSVHNNNVSISSTAIEFSEFVDRKESTRFDRFENSQVYLDDF